MSVTDFEPVGHQERAGTAPDRRARAAAWLPTTVVRYRAMTLVPLAVLAGVAIATLAGVPGLVDLSGNGSGCCPPAH